METKRNIEGHKVVDPHSLANLGYNNAAGAHKQVNVGPKLLPLRLDATTWTTDATTAIALCKIGRSIAVYNNSAALESITFGMDSTVGVLGSGVTGTGAAAQHVGLPCPPATWSYFSGADYQWVIASSVNLLVYLIADDTFLTVEDPA